MSANDRYIIRSEHADTHAHAGPERGGDLLVHPSREPLFSLADTLGRYAEATSAEERERMHTLPTGFSPLDDLLGGGLRAGDLMIVGGAAGVGKTIFGLQVARNAVARNPAAAAMVICFEHDAFHLTSRLLCLESAELGMGDDSLTLARLGRFTDAANEQRGVIALLRSDSQYGRVVQAVDRYASRLFLVKASGRHSTLDRIAEHAEALARINPRSVLVLDYLQKIPVDSAKLEAETEATTYLAQGIKDLAMETGLRIVAIAALDHEGLRHKRLRLSDMRGSSAIQYEADVGIIFNNKFDIVSREHLVYNENHAQDLQRWLVMTVEKNRAGRARVDMEYGLDAAHFRLISKGGYVRERLIDDRLTLA